MTLASDYVGHISAFSRPFGAPRMHMDEDAASAPPDSGAVVREASADTGHDISISQAARALSNARRKPAAPAAEPTPAESPEAPAEPELSDEGSAAPDESQATGETTEQNQAETPPIPLPKSWTKEQAEHWNALPRATQEYLTERASKDSLEVRRVQNEAAAKVQGLTAKEQAAEQARTQYETKIKSVVEVLENEQLREFPDIRTQADLDKLSSEYSKLALEAERLSETDPFAALQAQTKANRVQAKLSAWNIHQQKLVAATGELKAAETRKSQESKNAWAKHVQDESKLAAEKIPELADPIKAKALMERVVPRLSELGFTQDELTKLNSGDEKISIHDHRMQQLIYSDLRLAEILKAPKAIAAKPVPPVQRPGTPAPRGSAQSEAIKALTNKLNSSGSFKDAVALRLAQQRAASRA
jgi:hypothetical protein